MLCLVLTFLYWCEFNWYFSPSPPRAIVVKIEHSTIRTHRQLVPLTLFTWKVPLEKVNATASEARKRRSYALIVGPWYAVYDRS